MFRHWEAEHCPAGTVVSVKAACPYFETDSNACPVSLTAAVYDLKRHLKNVHGVANKDIASYNLQSRCSKVNKSAPKRPSFVSVSAEELTMQFMRCMAIKKGIVASNLLSRPDAPMPKTKSQRGRRPSLEIAETGPVPNDASQRPPPSKKAKGSSSHGGQRKHKHATPAANSRSTGGGWVSAHVQWDIPPAVR